MPRFKRWLKGLLQREKITVTFTKKDGSTRVMLCTADPTYIMFKDPSTLESKQARKVSEDTMTVFDLEANAWRSFRWDSIQRVSITLGS
jgi:hypothetical protein